MKNYQLFFCLYCFNRIFLMQYRFQQITVIINNFFMVSINRDLLKNFFFFNFIQFLYYNPYKMIIHQIKSYLFYLLFCQIKHFKFSNLIMEYQIYFNSLTLLHLIKFPHFIFSQLNFTVVFINFLINYFNLDLIQALFSFTIIDLN